MIQCSAEILYSPGSNDECYTPAYGVWPIIPYVPRDAVVWCPFDTEDSQFVKLISRRATRVVFSHISLGQDYYYYEPAKWDVMVSNPPYTNKRKIFERALSFGKPFALLMSNTWLNDAAPKQLFRAKELQLLMFEQRIHYTSSKKTTFSSSYYCWNFLPQQIIMSELSGY